MLAPLTSAVRAPREVLERMRRMQAWCDAFRGHLGPEGMQRFGPSGVWNTITGYASSGSPPSWPEGLGERDPAFVDLALDLARVVGKFYFRWHASGMHHVPDRGAAMIVGNHNGGVLPTDTLLTLLALWEEHGPDRAVHPLGHDLLWQDPVARKLVAKLGLLRAHPDSAHLALEAGHAVLVYPGSDLDAWRPWTKRGRVELGHRTGFIRVALQHEVPVVPVVSVGTHEQLFVLATGRGLARRLRLKRLIRSEAFPLIFALPWGVTSGFFPYLPLPAQTSIRFGPPIRWPHLDRSAADDPDVVERCFRQVEAAMQVLLDDLHRWRIPLIGRPKIVERLRR